MKKILGKEKTTVQKFKRNEKIGFLAFLALTSSMVLTVYEYPLFALSGWAIILFLLVAGACFFLPIAIAAAEMGTVKKWEKGGIFIWVRNTLGRRWGFVAIFYQWFAITIAFMAMLYFISSALGFTFGGVSGFNWLTEGNGGVVGQAPFQLSNVAATAVNASEINAQIALINSNHGLGQIGTLAVAGALFGVICLVFITVTVTQLFGVKYTSMIARVGFTIGIAIPTFILIGLGSAYIAQGHPTIPNIQGGGVTDTFTRGSSPEVALTLFVAVILSFIGVEGSGSLASRLKNPNRNYPLAVITLLFIAISFSTLAAIMISISSQNISQTGGVFVTMVNLFIQTTPGLDPSAAIAGVRVISFFLSFGVIAQIAAWVIGPAQGLKFAADKKLIPSIFSKTNKFDVPIVNIAVQTVLVIIWNLIITVGLGHDGSGSFQAGISVTVIVYLSCYFVLFTGYMKMAFKAPKIGRVFKIKFRFLQFIIGIIGFGMSALGFCVSFINPGINPGIWFGVLCALSIVGIVLPFIIYELFHKYQVKKGIDVSAFDAPVLENETEADLLEEKRLAELEKQQETQHA